MIAVRAPAALTIRFRFLGQFAILASGEWHDGPAPKRGRDLLQYLASYPRRVAARDALAEAFWPGEDLDAVAHRIHLAASGARSYLRTILDGYDAIVCQPGGYTWNAAVRITSDVEDFLNLAKSSVPDAAHAAVELYGGLFLAGESGDWLQPLRVRCSCAYEGLIERLADDAANAGDLEAALAYGLQLVEAEPGHESATRLVMRCLARLGRRARALDVYGALTAYLARHLGIGPARETTLLALELRGCDFREPAESGSRAS